MPDRLTLSGSALLFSATALGGCASATAALLHFAFDAPPAFTLIIACLSVPALTLLFYIGLLLHRNPGKPAYLAPLKGLAILSVAMSMVILLDFVLPVRTDHLPIQSKITEGNETILRFGGYRQAVNAAGFSSVHEGQQITLTKTALLGRIASLRAAGSVEPDYRRSILEKAVLALSALAFFLPAGLFAFTPHPNTPSQNMAGYFGLVVPSYIFSLVASGLWIKLFLVHVFHAIDKM